MMMMMMMMMKRRRGAQHDVSVTSAVECIDVMTIMVLGLYISNIYLIYI